MTFQTAVSTTGAFAVGLSLFLAIAVVIERLLGEPKRRQEAAEHRKHQVRIQQYKAFLASLPPEHLHRSLQEVETFLTQNPQGPSPYIVADLLRYKRDCFEFTHKYMRDGENCFDEIASALIQEKPNWIKFLVDHYDAALSKNSSYIPEIGAARSLQLALIVDFASQYCREHRILTMPQPKPGSADTGSFGHAFIRLIAEAKAAGTLVAGEGI